MEFEVTGAGSIRIEHDAISYSGGAAGLGVGVSWGRYGYIGGVLDAAEVRKLRDALNEWLDRCEEICRDGSRWISDLEPATSHCVYYCRHCGSEIGDSLWGFCSQECALALSKGEC